MYQINKYNGYYDILSDGVLCYSVTNWESVIKILNIWKA